MLEIYFFIPDRDFVQFQMVVLTMRFASGENNFASEVEINWSCHCIEKCAQSAKNHIGPICSIKIHDTEKYGKHNQTSKNILCPGYPATAPLVQSLARRLADL